jgi:hypothetical protein
VNVSAVAATSEQQSAELTRALIELDAAWEAHRLLQTELDKQGVELVSVRQYRAMERPRGDAFERISTAIWLWSNSSPEAQEANAPLTLKKIMKIVAEARAEIARIAEVQRKRREAA